MMLQHHMITLSDSEFEFEIQANFTRSMAFIIEGGHSIGLCSVETRIEILVATITANILPRPIWNAGSDKEVRIFGWAERVVKFSLRVNLDHAASRLPLTFSEHNVRFFPTTALRRDELSKVNQHIVQSPLIKILPGLICTETSNDDDYLVAFGLLRQRIQHGIIEFTSGWFQFSSRGLARRYINAGNQKHYRNNESYNPHSDLTFQKPRS
jgi:hypothetical protein